MSLRKTSLKEMAFGNVIDQGNQERMEIKMPEEFRHVIGRKT